MKCLLIRNRRREVNIYNRTPFGIWNNILRSRENFQCTLFRNLFLNFGNQYSYNGVDTLIYEISGIIKYHVKFTYFTYSTNMLNVRI